MSNENISDITQLLLNFYNKDFNNNEEEKNTNTQAENIYNLILNKKEPLEENKKTLLLTKQTPKKKIITDMNFIQDKDLFNKKMKYKLLEIKKKITILELIYVCYTYNIITLLHESSDLDKGEDNINCTRNLDFLVQYMKEYISNIISYLDIELKKYKELKEFFSKKQNKILI